MNNTQTINVVSLFDGVSCARVALERAGFKVGSYYSAEIDKYATEISKKNYPDIVRLGDVKGITADEQVFEQLQKNGIRPVFIHPNRTDLLIGGSPCQDLSIAKKDRKGLDGERSSLFWEYVRILNEVQPRFFILENVASMPKEAKDLISKTLGVEPVMINASLVSAQNRKRLFWVGKRNDRGGYEKVEIPLPEDKGIILRDILETNVDEKYYTIGNWKIKNQLNDNKIHGAAVRKQVNDYRGIEIRKDEKSNALNTIENHKLVRIGQIGKGGQGDRIYSPDGKSVNLSANGGGRGAKTGLYAVPVALRNRGEGKKPEYNGTGKANAMTSVQTDSMVAIVQKGRGYNKGGIKALDGKTPTLSSSSWQDNNHLTDGVIIRKLTPIECERLQGLPDQYTDGVSNSQRYKALGNAFNVDVVSHILKYLV